MEADEPVWVEVPVSLPPRRTRAPRPWGGRDPGAVIREGAEDLAPYAEVGANVAGESPTLITWNCMVSEPPLETGSGLATSCEPTRSTHEMQAPDPEIVVT